MAKLIYVANVSLDGYIEDAHGSFEWTAPIDEVLTFITDLVRPVGTYLYGRRMYETMAVWETQPGLAAQSELMADFANVWQGADKIVYSTTLHVVSTANTRLERRCLRDRAPCALEARRMVPGRSARPRSPRLSSRCRFHDACRRSRSDSGSTGPVAAGPTETTRHSEPRVAGGSRHRR